MPEELSTESKLYVKDEIEKSKKEIKEEIEKVKSKATKIFSTVVIVVGLLTGVGFYLGINNAMKQRLADAIVQELNSKVQKFVEAAEGSKADAKDLPDKIAESNTGAKDIQSFKIIIGTIVPYGGDVTKPGVVDQLGKEGWLVCDGQRVTSSDYPELSEVIGVAFGEPDSNTFSLPDLRGRVVVGAGSGKELTPRELGERGGEEKHTLTIGEMPRHRHKLSGVTINKNDDYGFGGSEKNIYQSSGDTVNIGEYIGNNQSHNNMQPFLVVNYIIKAR